MKKITKKTLEGWNACKNGKDFFLDKFPNGSYLKEASEYMLSSGHKQWSNWLWENCARNHEYVDQTVIVAGDFGTATSGDWGTATAGNDGTAAAGHRGTATAGHLGTAAAGDFGTATSGDWGTATAGDWGTAAAGHRGTAAAGHRGTATAGNDGTATAGYRGTATAGHLGTAAAGHRGTATAGENGSIIIKHWNGERYIACVANVGINGILPNVPYKLSDDGTKFVRADGGVK